MWWWMWMRERPTVSDMHTDEQNHTNAPARTIATIVNGDIRIHERRSCAPGCLRLQQSMASTACMPSQPIMCRRHSSRALCGFCVRCRCVIAGQSVQETSSPRHDCQHVRTNGRYDAVATHVQPEWQCECRPAGDASDTCELHCEGTALTRGSRWRCSPSHDSEAELPESP